MSLWALLKQIATDVKVAAGVGGVTTVTGTASWVNWSPEGLLQLATLLAMIAGGALSITLIVVHWKKSKFECRKVELEISIMKTREAERLSAAKKERRRVSDLKAGAKL